MKKQFKIVGHRGWPEKFPENSLEGALHALKGGIDAIELDVQLTGDAVPIVMHDANLRRTCNFDVAVCHTSYEEIAGISCDEKSRFLFARSEIKIPRLDDFSNQVSKVINGKQQVFVEIKPESLRVHGVSTVFEKVKRAIKPLWPCVVLISFDYDFLAHVKKDGQFAVGWVLTDLSQDELSSANLLIPDFLIADHKKILTDQRLWEGNWQWFLYDIVDKSLAGFWFKQGVDYIETWDFPSLQARE